MSTRLLVFKIQLIPLITVAMIFIAMLIVTGCVLVPTETRSSISTKTRSYGVIDIETLESMSGISLSKIKAQLGEPNWQLTTKKFTYLLYRGEWEVTKGIPIVAPWYILAPYYTVLLAEDDLYSGDICYLFRFIEDRELLEVTAKKIVQSDCRKAFWTSEQILALEKEEAEIFRILKREEKKQIRALENRLKKQIPMLDAKSA